MTDTNITRTTESRHVITIEKGGMLAGVITRDEYVVYSDGDCITIEHDLLSVSIPVIIAEDVMKAMDDIIVDINE